MSYDIKTQMDKRAGNAKTSGTALQGAWVLVSDCESLTTQAGTLGAWSAVGALGTNGVSIDASVYKQGAGSVEVDLAATSLDTGCKFTATTPFNWSKYNYLGFWYRATNTLSAGNLTLSLDDSNGVETLASVDFPALLVNDKWTYVTIPLAACTNLTDVAVIHIICEDEIGTYDFFVDNLEAFEFRAGKGPLKAGIVKKVKCGTTAFAVGDAVELEPVQQSYSLGTADDARIAGLAITAGTENSTQQGDEVAWILVEGNCILRIDETITAGDGLNLKSGSTTANTYDDGGADVPLQYGFYAVEGGGQYEDVVCFCQGLRRRPTTG